jgi:mono/diheme cytochrome c family protein
MNKTLRSQVVLALVVGVSSAVCFAQSGGDATYKAKCQSCHGSAGVPSPGMASAMGIKPNTDPSIKSMTVDQMVAGIKGNTGKMKSVAALPEADIRAAVIYYRSLK